MTSNPSVSPLISFFRFFGTHCQSNSSECEDSLHPTAHYTCNVSCAVVVMATNGDWELVHTLSYLETDQNKGRRKVLRALEEKIAVLMFLIFVCLFITLVNIESIRVDFPQLNVSVLPSGVNCTKVWQGDMSEISGAKLLWSVPARRPAGFYDNITTDCPKYRRETGYMEQVSEEEKAFPLAFSILLYKDVEQVERLLRAVYRPHNLYCLHTDLKASAQVQRQITALVTCLPNVFQAPRQVEVVWGTFTVLEPELICMEALLQRSKSWRYFINLTGQEFPLKTNKELVAILQAYRGANDIFGTYLPNFAHRWDKAGPAPHTMTVAKGPVHMAASREFVDYALHSTYARDLLEWIKKTGFPDESFFTTLNNQHQLVVPGAYTGELDCPQRQSVNRYKIWFEFWSDQECSGKWVRQICNFGVGDIHRMVDSVFMFANKFTYNLQPQAFDCLEQWYFSRIQREEVTGELDLSVDFYSNLDIVKHALRKNLTQPC